MQWLNSEAQDKAVSRLGGAPTRLSTLSDVDLVRQYPEYITLKQQPRYADPDWRPIIAPWDEINQGPLGATIHQGITGAKPAAPALNEIVLRVSDIMRRAGFLAGACPRQKPYYFFGVFAEESWALLAGAACMPKWPAMDCSNAFTLGPTVACVWATSFSPNAF